MTTLLLALKGTWEEIVAQIPDFSGQKLRVLVYPATKHSAEGHDTRPIAEVSAEIAAAIPAGEAGPVTVQTPPTTAPLYLRHPQTMTQVFADTLYWVASITPGYPWYAPRVASGRSLGTCGSCHDRGGAGGFLSAYAGRGAYLRQEALKTVRAIQGDVHVTVLP